MATCTKLNPPINSQTEVETSALAFYTRSVWESSHTFSFTFTTATYSNMILLLGACTYPLYVLRYTTWRSLHLITVSYRFRGRTCSESTKLRVALSIITLECLRMTEEWVDFYSNDKWLVQYPVIYFFFSLPPRKQLKLFQQFKREETA